MINYTSNNQLSLSLFKHPFERELDPNNRWVLLAALIPWDKLASVYASNLESNIGRKSVDIRHVIGALIVKHKLRLDDRGTIEMIQENIYLQYFCGLKEFTIKPIFDPSLFVDIRKRLGLKEFERFNKYVISKSEDIKPHQARITKKNTNKKDNDESSSPLNKGSLKIDATVSDQEIKFPTDIDLLNTSRENLERMIDKMYQFKKDKKKPRTYRRVARKNFLKISKKKRKSKNEIRKAIRIQLENVRRDIDYINEYIAKGRSNKLSKRDKTILQTIKEIYEQQKYMYDNKISTHPKRIVSVYQPYVRPIPRGKARSNTEFGAKINISLVNGFTRIDRLNWEAYNEGEDVELQIKNYYQTYACYPAETLADRIYLTRKNRKYFKELDIKTYGKPLGRPSKDKKTTKQKYRDRKKESKRNQVEGKFGQAKRGYGLNNIRARRQDTSESWISAIIFITNLQQLLKVAEKYGYFFVQNLNSIFESVVFVFLNVNILKKKIKPNFLVL